jgi:hypothetical protein
MCDDAGRADAVNMIMLHAILRQCRPTPMLSATCDNASPPSRGKCRRNVDAVCYMRQCFTSLAREMPVHTDAVRFGRQCFTSFTREMPGNADAVRFCRQRFTSFMREMPTNRRCRPSRCGLCGHAVCVPCRLCGYAVSVAMWSLWPCGYWGYAVLAVMQSS